MAQSISRIAFVVLLTSAAGLARPHADDPPEESTEYQSRRSTLKSTAPNVDLGPYCSQKDQGRLGTCHAFALSCPIEYLENRGIQPAPKGPAQPKGAYRVSSNWLVFLSVLDRLCDSKSKQVRVNEGYYVPQNIDRLMSLGYCSEKVYRGYNGQATKRSVSPKADSGEGTETSNDTLALSVYKELPKAIAEESGPKSRGSISNPQFAKRFRTAFGIDWKDARDALCRKSPADRLKGMSALYRQKKLGNKIYSCFVDGFVKARALNQVCAPKHESGSPDASELEKLLDKGQPVAVSIKNYLPRKPKEEDGYHAVSIVGYNKTSKTFLVRNSWGPGENHPIPYSAVNRIRRYSYLNCLPRGIPPIATVQASLGKMVSRFHDFSGSYHRNDFLDWADNNPAPLKELKNLIRKVGKIPAATEIFIGVSSVGYGNIRFVVNDRDRRPKGYVNVSLERPYGVPLYGAVWETAPAS